MYESKGPIDQLVHLWVDGAFNRRELISRVARHTGSVAAAVTTLKGYEVWAQTASACPADVRVSPNDPDIITEDVSFPSQGVTVNGLLAYPRNSPNAQSPGVIVIHENRGLVEHIRDVARRTAKAGFVALAPDLLSRQGGIASFPEPTQQTQAYNRVTPAERLADLTAAMVYLKSLPQVVPDRIGVTGFCAGGGNTWSMVANIPEITAAVPFYGAPANAEGIERIQAAVLAIYAERDRNLTTQMLTAANTMIQRQKNFGMVVYNGAGHAFHNDTGAAYNAEAACDAWARTIGWFNRWLRA